MEFLRRWTLLILIAAGALGLHYYLVRMLSASPFFAVSPARRVWLRRAAALAAFVLAAVPVAYITDLDRLLPSRGSQWVMAAVLFWCLGVTALAAYAWISHRRETDRSRRVLVKSSALAAAGLPIVGAGAAVIIARSGPSLREVDVRIRGLHRDLDGLRIAQISDIHFGAFFGPRELNRTVAMANETRPHLTMLTGDLITRHSDDLEACVSLLEPLRADAGVYGCHGNHETYARALERATELCGRLGFRFLRGRAEALRFGDARLNLAGYDYQPKGSDYLRGAESLVDRDAFNLLLSHNPDVFPRAAQAGFDLTLSGHTHGGQVNFEILHENLNVARFFTPYVLGLYEERGAAVYVSAGLGTVGAPVRLGAPPEVTLVRLCAG